MANHFERLGSIATIATVSLMFVLLINVSPWLITLSAASKTIALVVGVVLSLGTYKAFAGLLFAVFRQSIWLRRKVLGQVFLEGTWVGCLNRGNARHFTVEFIDQESGNTQITGREFDENGATCASWTSTAASVDGLARRLEYAYTCDVYSRGGRQDGLGVFDLVGTGKKNPPTVLDGHASDLFDGLKDTNKEHKVSDHRLSDDEALVLARKAFETKP